MTSQSFGVGEELYEENSVLYLLKIQNFLLGLANGEGSNFVFVFIYLHFFLPNRRKTLTPVLQVNQLLLIAESD